MDVRLRDGLQSSGCSEEQASPNLGPRPVKVVDVGAGGAGAARIIGTVRARQRATIAFQIGGRIATLPVDVGDAVQLGTVVATLDRAPFELRVSQARAEVSRAAATATEARSRVNRQERLLNGGWVAPAAVGSARAEAGAADGALEAARAAEAMARCDLAQTSFEARFSGRIARRAAEPFAEVAAGAVVVELDGDTGLEAVAPVPAPLAAVFHPGAAARLSARGVELAGEVERVSPRAGEAGTVDVIVRLNDAVTGDAQSGDAIEITADRRSAELGLSLPLAALLLSEKPGEGAVFVVDDGKARRRAVTFDPGLTETVMVTSGLAAKDQVVAAGARFLNEGEAVVAQAPRVR